MSIDERFTEEEIEARDNVDDARIALSYFNRGMNARLMASSAGLAFAGGTFYSAIEWTFFRNDHNIDKTLAALSIFGTLSICYAVAKSFITYGKKLAEKEALEKTLEFAKLDDNYISSLKKIGEAQSFLNDAGYTVVDLN